MIVGICGLAGSGKDTAADRLVKKHGFVKVSLADPLKRYCKEVYDFSDEQLWGPSQFRNAPDLRYPRTELNQNVPPSENMTYLTPRYALQKLGTEWGRDCYDNTWIDLGIRTAQKLLNGGKPHYYYSAQKGLWECPCWNDTRPYQTHPHGIVPKVPGVVIPDIRFKNEVAAIKAAGGELIQIIRLGSGLEGEAAAHRSETEQLEIPIEAFDFRINNSGTMEMLLQAVDDFWERGGEVI